MAYLRRHNSVFGTRRSAINFKVYVLAKEISRAAEITNCLHLHFAYCRKKSEKQLRRTFQLGWVSLFIGFVFLGVIYALTEVLNTLIPENGFIATLRESFIILGWVALWRPAELLLYEWRPIKRNVILFHRLEYGNVQVIPEDKMRQYG